MSTVQQLIYCKTNIGGWFFDAYLHTDHTSKLTITEHPIQSGASISDHAYLNPAELVIEIGMSDAHKSIVSGQFTSKYTRSVSAYDVLRQLQVDRVPISILTRLRRYDNMLVENISVPDDYTTLWALKATVTFREILVGTVKTVKLSSQPQKTNSTNKGTVEPVQPNQSVLKQLMSLLGGN